VAKKARLVSLAVNLGVSAGSTAIFLLLCELVVFRFLLPGSDVPWNSFANDVVRYAPNQTGIWRVRNEIRAPFAINSEGWNSGVGDYAVDRRPGTLRVAVVGDSYVEALQVPHDRSLGEQLAGHLGRPDRLVEVYRFGIGGAPLSQYLHMIEREVARYRPDWIVVLMVHNDFDESFASVPGRYTSSFLKLQMENGRVVGEIRPTPWTPSLVEWLRHGALVRFFYYRWQARWETLKNFLVSEAHAGGGLAANIDVTAVLRKRAEIEAATDYLFGRLARAARGIDARLLLAMDGDRGAIYAQQADSAPLILNRLATQTAEKHGIPLVDLHPAFLAEWKANGGRFEFRSDSHWNERGHAVAAAAIAQAIRSDAFEKKR
jgi:hypothetical protein